MITDALLKRKYTLFPAPNNATRQGFGKRKVACRATEGTGRTSGSSSTNCVLRRALHLPVTVRHRVRHCDKLRNRFSLAGRRWVLKCWRTCCRTAGCCVTKASSYMENDICAIDVLSILKCYCWLRTTIYFPKSARWLKRRRKLSYRGL